METQTAKLTYEQIRQIIIDKCREQSACGSKNNPHDQEFGKLINADTEEGFWTVIKNNALWAHEHGVISIEILEKYDIKTLNENNIFIDGGVRNLDKDKCCINYYGTVSENNGTVSYNGNNGTVSENYGTVSENSGTVSKNYGTVSKNYGTVSYNGNYGTVSGNYGTAVVIERQNKRIYMKNGEFEIVYFE